MKKKDLKLEILQHWIKIQEDEDLLNKKLEFIEKVCEECKEYEKKTFNNRRKKF